MVLESFIIFLNALISLNSDAEATRQPEQNRTETVTETEKSDPFEQADLWRGGWDYN